MTHKLHILVEYVEKDKGIISYEDAFFKPNYQDFLFYQLEDQLLEKLNDDVMQMPERSSTINKDQDILENYTFDQSDNQKYQKYFQMQNAEDHKLKDQNVKIKKKWKKVVKQINIQNEEDVQNSKDDCWFKLERAMKKDVKYENINVQILSDFQKSNQYLQTLVEKYKLKKVPDVNVKILEKYNIVLPQSWQIDLEETDFCFIQNANHPQMEEIKEKDFIKQQYVLVRKQIKQDSLLSGILIYSLKNPAQPFIHIDVNQYREEPLLCFFNQVSERIVSFILYCEKFYYKIKVNKNKQRQNNSQSEEFQIFEYEIKDEKYLNENNKGKYRFFSNKIDIMEMKMDLNPYSQISKKTKLFSQKYFINRDGYITLISPLFKQLINDSQNGELEFSDYELVQNIIGKKHGIDRDMKSAGLVQLYFNKQIDFQMRTQQLHSFLKSFQLIVKKNVVYNQIFCMQDMIICTKTNNQIDVYSIQNSELQKSFHETYTDLVSSGSKLFLSKILQNFDYQNERKRKIYQNNYNFESNKEQCNQYLESYYINRRKQGLFQTHNRVFFNEKEYIFDQRSLVIDLSSENEKNVFKLIKLYDQGDLKNKNSVKNVKLVKYHRSKNVVIFVFLHRDQNQLDEENELKKNTGQLSGVHFFVVKTVQQLIFLANSKQPLIQYKKTNVYIPVSIDNFDCVIFSLKTLLHFEKQTKGLNYTSTQIEFEMVRDLNEQTSEWLPMLFYNQVATKRYEPYLCFINIEEMHSKLQKDFHENEGDERINFNEYLEIFKIDYYKSSSEKMNLADVYEGDSYRLHDASQVDRSCSLFCRSSNWQENLLDQSYFSSQFSATFKIGTNISIGSTKYIEIREYLITIDKCNSKYENPDKKILNKETEINSCIQAMEIQQIMLFRSQDLQANQNLTFLTPYENDRLVPNIDDNGNISNTLVLLNQIQTNLGIYQITSDPNILSNFKDQYEQLRERLGQQVFVTSKDQNKFSGYFFDGHEARDIPFALLNQFSEIHKKQDDKNEALNQTSQRKHLEINLNKFYKEKVPEYCYLLFQIENGMEKSSNSQQINGKITNQYIKSFSFYNIENQQIQLASTSLKKHIIQQQYFNKIESSYWLHYYQKLLICTGLLDFREAFNISESKQVQKYFQPRLFYDGQNYCHHDQFENIREALPYEMKSDSKFEFFQNSILYQSSIKDLASSNENLKKIIKVLNIDQYFNLQYSFFKYKSIIEKATKQKFQKVLQFIVDYMLQQANNETFNFILVQDFSLLLSQQKININNFFNISFFEKSGIDEILDNQNQETKLQLNNLEIILESSQLPQFGDDQLNIHLIDQFQGSFWTKDEICKFIVQVDENQLQNENIDQKKDEESSEQVRMAFTFINFQIIINKIKIDKILGKQSKQLDLINKDPQEIKEVDDIYISNLICLNSGNQEFITSRTIEKIINFQFTRARPVIKKLLYLYFFGFCLPFLYLIFEQHYEHLEQNYDGLRPFLRYFLLFIATTTQIILFVFELVQIWNNGFQRYFMDAWNWIDCSQFFFFMIYFCQKVFQSEEKILNWQKLQNSVLQIIIVLETTSRILQYMRFDDRYSFLVQMMYQVFTDIIPFFCVFFMYLILFCTVTLIIGSDFSDEDYPNLPGYIRILVSHFRTSIGDLNMPDYSYWKDKEDKDKESNTEDFLSTQPYAIALIWIFWFLNVFGMLIILANFLINEVGETFSAVKTLGNTFLNREKANFNQMAFEILALFGKKNGFSVLVFQQNANSVEAGVVDDQFFGLIEEVKNNTGIQLQKMQQENAKMIVQILDKKSKIDPESKEQISQIPKLKKDFEYFQQDLDILKKDQANLKQDIQNICEIQLKNSQNIERVLQQLNFLIDYDGKDSEILSRQTVKDKLPTNLQQLTQNLNDRSQKVEEQKDNNQDMKQRLNELRQKKGFEQNLFVPKSFNTMQGKEKRQREFSNEKKQNQTINFDKRNKDYNMEKQNKTQTLKLNSSINDDDINDRVEDGFQTINVNPYVKETESLKNKTLVREKNSLSQNKKNQTEIDRRDLKEQQEYSPLRKR